MKYFLKIFFIFIPFLCFSQREYPVSTISKDLLKGMNAVMRLEEKNIDLHDYNSMTVRQKKIVTVLNKRGVDLLDLYIAYDDYDAIKDYGALLYDEQGKEVKKFKKKDFLDVSATGSNLYSDDRAKVLDFVPTSYPFTIEFWYELKTSSTVHAPRFSPIPYTRMSVEKCTYTYHNEKEIPLRTRKYNIGDFDIHVEELPYKYSYSVENIRPYQREYLSPHYKEFLPIVQLVPSKFKLKDTEAEISTWKEFGQFQREKLLKDRDALSEATKNEITQLVASMEDPRAKAKAIYEYMQKKTRYISVQVGIGGWQPTPANEVDQLGYGDCKGLTNYTMALLKSQGIDSYYTLVYAKENEGDIDEEFVFFQGNHAILSVPFEDEIVFLECTSQDLPFNYLGTFTDDRKVLMVTPEGGVLKKTHTYTADQNIQKINVKALISPEMKIRGSVQVNSEGLHYNEKYWMDGKAMDDVESSYKDMWDYHGDIRFSNITSTNNKDEVVFKEEFDFETNGCVSKAGNRILIEPNLFTRLDYIPKKNEGRKLPFEWRRGYTYQDEVQIKLPKGYTIESVFEPFEIENEFGTYAISIENIDDMNFVYKRKLIEKKGRYPKEKYNAFIDFLKVIDKRDRSKIVLIKN